MKNGKEQEPLTSKPNSVEDLIRRQAIDGSTTHLIIMPFARFRIDGALPKLHMIATHSDTGPGTFDSKQIRKKRTHFEIAIEDLMMP